MMKNKVVQKLQYSIYFFLMVYQPFLAHAEEGELHLPPSAVVSPLLMTCQPSDPQDPSDAPLLSSELAPYRIELSENKEQSPPPNWVLKPAVIDEKEGTIQFFLPPLSEHCNTFALTVNFCDTGDGGPRIEWESNSPETGEGPSHKKEKKNISETTLISSGLGINGPALGLNSRTIHLQTDKNGISLIDGGTLTIRHTGRLRQILSATLRPGRLVQVATLGEKSAAAIIDESLNVTEEEVAEGLSSPSFKKEEKKENPSTTVLSSGIEHFEKSESGEEIFSKNMPLTKRPKASLLSTELQGLDLTSTIEVELNGNCIGTLNTSFFRLDAPELILKKQPIPAFELAGWQRAHLFIPPHLWKKNNHFLLRVKRGMNATPSKVHLKNFLVEQLY